MLIEEAFENFMQTESEYNLIARKYEGMVLRENATHRNHLRYVRRSFKNGQLYALNGHVTTKAKFNKDSVNNGKH